MYATLHKKCRTGQVSKVNVKVILSITKYEFQIFVKDDVDWHNAGFLVIPNDLVED
jgi:hypothetical protein